MVKVSVIMPSLNVVDYIDECIQSVINQTLREIEIICIDAGSTDGTYEKLLDYAKNDERIKVVLSAEKSYGRQINMGIGLARGKYIGIVETDDFIDSNMYSELYDLSEQYNLEFVKGDYEDVYSSMNSTYIMRPVKMFTGHLEKYYGNVICPNEIPMLHELGLNIWRGIYNRKFLLNNAIYLNETKGAAFQDTAFYHQIIIKSRRAMFVDKPYYKYRQDRAESSFRNPNTLIYTYNEYRYLIDKYSMDCDTAVNRFHWHYILVKSLREYVMHMRNYILTHNCEVNSLEAVSDKVKWFNSILDDAINNNVINGNDFDENVWNDFVIINQSVIEFANLIKVKRKITTDLNWDFWKELSNQELVIFGLGEYGRLVSNMLQRHGYNIVAYCDNNKSIKEYMGKKVLSPEEAVINFKHATYIVASKLYGAAMKAQLESLGISYSMIKKYSPLINWEAYHVQRDN